MNPRRLAALVAVAMAACTAVSWLVLRVYRASAATYAKAEGYKTYIIGTAYILHAILGWWLGDLQPNQAAERVLEGLGAMSLRAGVGKSRASPAGEAPSAPLPPASPHA